MDQPAHVKYATTMKAEFLDNAVKAETVESVATIVGVNRGEDMYKKVGITTENIFICNCFNLNLSLILILSNSQFSHPRSTHSMEALLQRIP